MTIPSCLVDTNILIRMTRRSEPQHKLVDTALARLAFQGTIFHYTHQNIAELWNVMTHPIVISSDVINRDSVFNGTP